jgi:hypothetical protein
MIDFEEEDSNSVMVQYTGAGQWVIGSTSSDENLKASAYAEVAFPFASSLAPTPNVSRPVTPSIVTTVLPSM